MSRFAYWKWGVAVLAVLIVAPLSPAAPVPPGKTPLVMVPEKAPLVLYLHGVERTRDRFIALVKTAIPDQADMIEKQVDMLLKEGFDNGRKLDGLEKDGPIFLAFLEMPKDFLNPPKMAFIIGVKDYAKFRDGLLNADQKKGLKKLESGVEEVSGGDAEKMYFLDRKGWAILAPDKESAELFTKEYKSLDARMSKEQATKLLDSDLGVYLGMDVFNKDYAEQIKAAKQAVNDQILPELEKTGALDKATIKVYRTMIESAFQAVEDSQGILATVEFRPTGLALHLETELRSGSTTSKNLKKFESSAFTDLSRMPTGQAYYTGIKPSPELIEAFGPLLFSVQGDPKKEEDKAIQAAIEKIIKAGPLERLDSVTVPVAGVQAVKYSDGTKAIEAHLDLVRALKADTAYQTVVVKDKATIKLKAQQYQNFDFHAIELPLDLEKTVQRQGMQDIPDEVKKALLDYYKKMLGGEKVSWWLGTDGKVVVQVVAADWKSAQKMLDAYFGGKGTLADDAAFKELRKELPAEASLFAAMDPVLYGTLIADGFRIGFEGAAMGMFKLPANFPAKPAKHVTTYFGMAITLKQERGTLDVFLSAKGLHESYKAFGKPFMNMF